MTAIFLKLAPWLIGIAVLAGGGAYAGYEITDLRWQTKYEALQAVDAQNRADGEEAVRKDLTAQLAQAQATSANNADSMVKLANENAHITADRDANLALARRLLSSAARPTPSSGGVSQAAGEPAAASASGPGGPTRAEVLLVAAADESERCANQLNSLIKEIQPQL